MSRCSGACRLGRVFRAARPLFVSVLFLALLWGIGTGARAQFGEQQVINQPCTACEVQDVHAADLDGDDDQDLLSASQADGKIAWYENDGNGSFSDQRVINTDDSFAGAVFAADLDGDGDTDVLSDYRSGAEIAWYENDGSGSFSGQQVISTDANGAQSVFAADLDGDGDQDVLSASTFDDKIAWYENDGSGSFSNQKVIVSGSDVVDNPLSVFAADLTGDGVPDVLSASSASSRVIL